jgi:large subunit ribosomal protein L13
MCDSHIDFKTFVKSTYLNMKTISLNANTVDKKWVVVDAADQSLGRIAAKVASILRGKTKPTFTPHVDCGDNVIIINASKVNLTGKKWDQKIYYHHTGFPGGIKSATAKEMREKKPSSLLKKAIQGMLPKNRLGRVLAGNFRVYDDNEHPHTAQNPETISI